MRKLKRFVAVCLMFTVLSSVTAFAGQWQKDTTGWWYLNDSGSYPCSTWQLIDGYWYCFDGAGYMLHDTWVGDYYLGSGGAMLTNTITPDGYYVGADGKWTGGSSTAAGNGAGGGGTAAAQ